MCAIPCVGPLESAALGPLRTLYGRVSMLRSVRTLAFIPAALVFAILAASPVAAVSAVKTTGEVGNWSFDETQESPLVTCKGGPEVAPDYSYMKSVKVKPPTVFAADRNSEKVDSRKVTWKFELQHTVLPSTNWKTVKSSAVQHATAHDNLAAPFSAMTVAFKANHDSATTADEIRVKVTIHWLKPNGSVEGTVTFLASYYGVISGVGNFTSGQPWCQEVASAG